jgi:hypothetical protein
MPMPTNANTNERQRAGRHQKLTNAMCPNNDQRRLGASSMFIIIIVDFFFH